MQELFWRAKSTISEHISNVFEEGELESNFKKSKKLSAELNPKELLDNTDKKNLDLFKNFLPASSTLSKVMKANAIESL